ncbi:MAG: methyltransferase domain-containing protein [Candidatus Hodarchaeota archaeon]
MPTLDWLKKEFEYGYDSGDVLSIAPDTTRAKEEKLIGGSYREVFFEAVLHYLKPASKVLELGPGRGAWTRAILEYLPQGELHTVDFQDVTKWLCPEKHKGRLVCHQVDNNSFACLENNYFDFFWSFGVLCHCNAEHISEILDNALPKMKPGGVAVHQYGDWNKLERFGWEKGGIPLSFKGRSDDDIWWPRNNQVTMSAIATATGWTVVTADLGLVKRDSIIVIKRSK